MRPPGAGEEPHPPTFEAHVDEKARPPLVVVRGEVDPSTDTAFGLAVDRALAAGAGVHIDLRDTTFMDSTGVRVIIRAFHHVGQDAAAVVLIDPTPEVRWVLELSGVDQIVTVRPPHGPSNRGARPLEP